MHFKKYVCAVLSFVLLLCTIGCNGKNADSDASSSEQSVNSNASQISESELGKYDINAVVFNGFDKVSTVADLETYTNTYKIGMAKNETESVQIALYSDKDFKNVLLDCKNEYDGISYNIYTENLVPCGEKSYPDPLTRFEEGEFAVPSGGLSVFYFDFKADETVQAGEYTFVFSALSDGQKVSNAVELIINVWDFALPQELSCRVSVGLDKNSFEPHVMYSDEVYLEYYEMLLDHGVCAYDLPYDILDSRADKYMSDPRVTGFRIPCSLDVPVDKLKQYYDKVKSNPEWFRKVYIYLVDEPIGIEGLNTLTSFCNRVRETCADIRIVCPYYQNIDITDSYDQTQYILNTVEIPCPKACMWDDEFIYSDTQSKKYPSFKSRMDEHIKNGGELWWYVCNTPGQPYLNVFIDEKGLDHRVLFWQQYRYGVKGFLYWSANFWKTTDNPWSDADTKTLNYPVYGEGFFMYPGESVGLTGPVASMRLKAIRDGAEDYELFVLAEKTLGRNYILEKLNLVSPDVTKVSVDSVGFSKIREQIGNDIENAMK